jgi:hypothetical protein
MAFSWRWLSWVSGEIRSAEYPAGQLQEFRAGDRSPVQGQMSSTRVDQLRSWLQDGLGSM